MDLNKLAETCANECASNAMLRQGSSKSTILEYFNLIVEESAKVATEWAKKNPLPSKTLKSSSLRPSSDALAVAAEIRKMVK